MLRSWVATHGWLKVSDVKWPVWPISYRGAGSEVRMYTSCLHPTVHRVETCDTDHTDHYPIRAFRRSPHTYGEHVRRSLRCCRSAPEPSKMWYRWWCRSAWPVVRRVKQVNGKANDRLVETNPLCLFLILLFVFQSSGGLVKIKVDQRI